VRPTPSIGHNEPAFRRCGQPADRNRIENSRERPDYLCFRSNFSRRRLGHNFERRIICSNATPTNNFSIAACTGLQSGGTCLNAVTSTQVEVVIWDAANKSFADSNFSIVVF
jgi:hypothetical protein